MLQRPPRRSLSRVRVNLAPQARAGRKITDQQLNLAERQSAAPQIQQVDVAVSEVQFKSLVVLDYEPDEAEEFPEFDALFSATMNSFAADSSESPG